MAVTTLSLIKINSNPSNNQVLSIEVSLKNNNIPVTDISENNFAVYLNGGETPMTSHAYSVTSNQTLGDKNYSITFSNSFPTMNDYLIVKVTKEGEESNRLFIDFSSASDSNGATQINNFKTSTSGQYSFVLDNVNNQNVDAKSNSYIFVNAANKDNSSIVVANYSTWQSIVVDNPITISVKLEDKDKNPIISPSNQISVYLKPEPWTNPNAIKPTPLDNKQ